jgi:hypothetical protein
VWDRSKQIIGTGLCWKDWLKTNPYLVEQGRVWYDSVDNRPYVRLFPKKDSLVNPYPVYVYPVFKDTTKLPVNTNLTSFSQNAEMWFGLFMLAMLLAVIFLFAWLRSRKFRKQENIAYDKNDEYWKNVLRARNQELEKSKNKEEIKAPPTVTNEWLQNNNPVGRPIREDGSDFASHIHGKKPDLIVQAKVSTEGNAISMMFSHGRTATTGLKDVIVYLGWNWDSEKRKWIEVGMIAGPCSNGFESNPSQIKKMDKLFTKVELVSKDRHPVVYLNTNVPEGIQYPKLVKHLVFQFHSPAIQDLKKTGVKVEIPENLK